MTPFIGHTARGKAALRPGADADQLAAVLRRALHTIECRELGPAAAGQQFGPLADTREGRVIVSADEAHIRARHPGHDELRQLVRAVRERGPAVDVVLVPPLPTLLLMDEMAHVVGESARSACGAEPGAARWLFEMRRPLRPCPAGADTADGR
ncbi:hypothetical protein [Streptomyces sp. NPDC059949]|uniref:hypothetical protein n=1 Tax=Streptomyces sp. NPDC059949 TaxID=3347013 RepID=UPI00365F03C8